MDEDIGFVIIRSDSLLPFGGDCYNLVIFRYGFWHCHYCR